MPTNRSPGRAAAGTPNSSKPDATPARPRRKSGVIEALLDEYRVVLEDLKSQVTDVSPRQLATVADPDTPNPDCVSIQSVLTHVVYCGYNYVHLMDRHRGGSRWPRPKRVRYDGVAAYAEALDRLWVDTASFFEAVRPAEMTAYDPARKLRAGWGELYDFEQLMEHAIVHVSRHRRQIRCFREKLGLKR